MNRFDSLVLQFDSRMKQFDSSVLQFDEKLGIINSAIDLQDIRELRNEIAHEFDG
jgi:hypothetical protein